MEPFRLHVLVDNRQSAALGVGERHLRCLERARAAIAHDARACKSRIG